MGLGNFGVKVELRNVDGLRLIRLKWLSVFLDFGVQGAEPWAKAETPRPTPRSHENKRLNFQITAKLQEP